MRKTTKATKLFIGAFLVALLLMVSVVLTAGPGSTGIAEAGGGPKAAESQDSEFEFGGFQSYKGGGGTESMGVTWTGID